MTRPVFLSKATRRIMPTVCSPQLPAATWEEKLVAVLAIEVTWPAAQEPDTLHYDPWTIHARWEHTGILGPTIRAEVGDTIKVVFRNTASVPYSMHPHGVRYAGDAAGNAINF